MTFLKDRKTKKILTLLFLMVVLVGCTAVVGKDGVILDKYIISETSPWDLSQGWFRFFFVIPIGKAMVFLMKYIGPIMAMAVVTIFTRIITLPLTLAQTEMSEKMKLAQPEIAKLQEQFKGRKDQQSQMQMAEMQQRIYRKYNIKMGRAMLGMFATLPIFLATYQAVQSVEQIYYANLWGMDLRINMFDGIKQFDFRYILLFLVVAVFQVLQIKIGNILAKRNQTSAARHHVSSSQPDPANATNNTMMFMIIAISLILPSIMGIYWIVTSIFMVVQTIFIHQIYLPKQRLKENK